MAPLAQKKIPKINIRIKKVFFIVLIILSSLLLQTKSHSSNFFPQDCKKQNKKFNVKQIYDGDTILIETKKNEKVRLLGIDTFELKQKGLC